MSIGLSKKASQAYGDARTAPLSYENSPGLSYGLQLGSTKAASFRSRAFVVHRAVTGTLHVQSTGAAPLNFESMYALRSDPANRALSHDDIQDALRSPGGFHLSNIGVSVALEITVDNRRFAVLVETNHSRSYKLISGYCDIGENADSCGHAAGELLTTACREITEELLICRLSSPPIAVTPLRVRTALTSGKDTPPPVLMPAHYVRNIEVDAARPPIEVIPHQLPAYLAGAFETSRIMIDGQLVEAAFYLDRRYRSGQVVFSFALDLTGCDYTLLHAEDAYCSDSRLLETVLHPDGLILAELGPHGKLLGDFCWLREGKLISIGRTTRVQVPGVFTTCSGSPGIIERGSVSISEYRLNQPLIEA